MQTNFKPGIRGFNEVSKIRIIFYILILSVFNYIFSIEKISYSSTLILISIYLVSAYLLLKLFVLDKNVKITPYFTKLIDFILISFITTYGEFNVFIFTLFVIGIIYSTYISGNYERLKVFSIFGMVSYIELVTLNFKPFSLQPDTLFTYALYILGLLIIAYLSRYLPKKMIETDNDDANSDKKYEDLILENKELESLNIELKCKVNNLEQKSKKDSRSIAELTTIQEVSHVVNSTLDTKELLNLVNDVIIGLLGAAYCSIFLRVEGQRKIEVKSSNITNQKYLDDLTDVVITKMFELVEESHKSVSNNVDPYSYPNGLDRGIESTLFVPILNKGKTLGIILAEHTMQNWADDQTRKFVETVANQIGLAIENAMLYEEMERLATIDALTRVYNRMYFQNTITEEIEKAKGRYPISLLMMDIDNFKRFNDNYGHDFGDEVLKGTAQVVKNSLNSNGNIFRVGGEEFVIMFRNTGIDEAYKMGNDLRNIIQNNIIKYNNKAVNITVSMGISEFPTVAQTEKSLLKTADEALYKAKEDGRNCVRKAISLKQPKDNPDDFMKDDTEGYNFS